MLIWGKRKDVWHSLPASDAVVPELGPAVELGPASELGPVSERGPASELGPSSDPINESEKCNH